MMNKKQRIKLLKQLACSSEGKALKELFEEKIGILTDSRSYSKEDFEIEGKASIKAAAVLEKIMIELALLAKPTKKTKKNQYI